MTTSNLVSELYARLAEFGGDYAMMTPEQQAIIDRNNGKIDAASLESSSRKLRPFMDRFWREEAARGFITTPSKFASAQIWEAYNRVIGAIPKHPAQNNKKPQLGLRLGLRLLGRRKGAR